MKVVLMSYDKEEKIAQAARLCYYSKNIDDLTTEIVGEKAGDLIKKLKSLEHESPFEHVSYTFGIEGISRACSHQLVRHRIASYNQQSQRYVKESNFDYIIPETIKETPGRMEYFLKIMDDIQTSYNKLIELGVNKEDARYVLPNACETKIIVTINARSLNNFFKLRCAKDAQWEIRELANEMKKLVTEVHPNIWSE
jgi:thymidylate synthase (FAD)